MDGDNGFSRSEVIVPGIAGQLEATVTGELLTKNLPGKAVLATPAMIGLMELAAHRSVEGLLADGFTTVGYEVHVRHLAPTRAGDTVVVTSLLTKTEGRKLYFDVSCTASTGQQVGTGTHKRVVVPISA